jgi:HD superfamily phosphodiesterase
MIVTPEIVDKIRNAMREVTPGHGIDHVERVVKNTESICSIEQVDSLTQSRAILAAWLHDLGRAYEKDSGKHHAELSVEKMSLILGSGEHDQDLVQAIAEHSQFEPASTLTGRILQDADKLDGFGVIGLERAVAYRTSLGMETVVAILTHGVILPEERPQLEVLFSQLKMQKEWFHMLHTGAARELGFHGHAQIMGYTEHLYNALFAT